MWFEPPICTLWYPTLMLWFCLEGSQERGLEHRSLRGSERVKSGEQNAINAVVTFDPLGFGRVFPARKRDQEAIPGQGIGFGRVFPARNRDQEAIPGLGVGFGRVFPARNRDQEAIPGLGTRPWDPLRSLRT